MRRLLLPSFALTLIVLAAACSKPQPVALPEPPPKPGDPPTASVPAEEVPTPREELVAQKDEPDQPEGLLVGEQLGGSTENAQLVLNPLGHVGAIVGVFFSPDGKQLVTVGQDTTVQLWDAASGQRLNVLRLPVRPLQGPDVNRPLFPGGSCSLSPDGQTLAYCPYIPSGAKELPGRHVILVNLHDGRLLRLKDREKFPGRYHALAFSRDGDRLAASHHGPGNVVVVLWEGLKGIWEKKPEEAGKLKGRLITPEGKRDLFDICSLAFSPDGQRLALGRMGVIGNDAPKSTVFLQDVPVGAAKPGTPVPLGNHHKTVRALAWSPDGQQVAATFIRDNIPGGTEVRVWSAAQQLLLHEFKLRPDSDRDGHGLHFLNDKEILFTWIQDGKGNQPPSTGQSILTLDNPVTERKGPSLPLSGGYKGASAVFIDRTDPKKPVPKLAAFTGGIFQNEIVIWEVATLKPLHPSPLGSQLRTPLSAGWSKDGRSLGFDAFEDNKKSFFRSALDLKELVLRAEPVDRSDYLYRYRANGEWSMRYYPKKRDWELRQGDKLVLQKLGGDFASTLSPAEKPSWAAWREGKFLILFDLVANKQVARLAPSPQFADDLAPSPDGRWLVSVNNQQVMYLYRIADDPAQTKPAPLLYLYLSQGEWVMWTKEGYYAASPNGEKLMGWTVESGPGQLPTFHPAQRFRKQLYRPELIQKVIELGSVEAALKALDGVKAKSVNLEKLLPPKVTELKVDDSKKPKVTVQVKAEPAVENQWVAGLRLLVDGRPWPGAVKELKLGDKPEAEWTIDLPEGEHQLAVLTRSPDASTVSHAVRVRNVNPAKQPVMHLLPIGINYGHDPTLKLDFAAADARAIADAFKQGCKGPLFADVKGEPLLNEKATRAGVQQALAQLRKGVKPNDLVVVFFAGHGIKEKDRFYLLPVEANTKNLAQTALSGEELRKALGEFPCQVLLLLDACHSAVALQAFKPATDDAARALTDDEVGVAILCAAMGHEKAIEKKELQHGLFTHALVQALSRTERLPYNFRDNRQYLHHLHSFVFDEVKALSEDRQHPFLSLPSVVESFALRYLPSSPGER